MTSRFFNILNKGADTMNILAIGAHPDDIEFGCGGTLIKYAQKGHNVYQLIMTGGGVGGDPGVRTAEQQEAAKFIGVQQVFWGNFHKMLYGKYLVGIYII